jgi:hypothetical protein
MGYTPEFEEDVFISYATHDDDIYAQETVGWVSRLHKDLAHRIRSYLGSEIRFWRDSEIRNNDDFTIKILGRLPKTATFLSVLSPSSLNSVWCNREVDAFAGHAEKDIGILVDQDKSRIFKIEKIPVDIKSLPPAMQGTKTYRFFEPLPGQPHRMRELRPLLGDEYSRRYFEQMDELARDIASMLMDLAKLKRAAQSQPKAERAVVYVAETTSELDEKASELRRDLKDRGYLVLPAGDLPYRGNAYKQKVRECLEQAALSVHLIGADYGFVPEGETKSNVWLQHELAAERGSDANFMRLVWMPGEVASADPRQQGFITELLDGAGAQRGADLLNGSIEEFKSVIYEMLAEIRKRREAPPPPHSAPSPATTAPPGAAAQPTVPTRAADEPVRVYLICDQVDRKSPGLVALRRYLLAQSCEPMLPTSADADDALQQHIETLRLCDACLIYYGDGSPAWFEQKLRDLRKYLRGRQPAVLAKAIYIAPPANDDKDEVETLEAIVLRGTDTFTPEAIEPFMQKIRAATAPA